MELIPQKKGVVGFWRGVFFVALLLAIFKAVDPERLASSTNLAILYAICILWWAIWTTFIYPFFISPLKHLPMPKGNHWLWGHGMKLLREPQGNPSKEW